MHSTAFQRVGIATAHLFPVLDGLLISLLRDLEPEEWHLPTVAKKWTVKDVAAHLLDGHLRGLSTGRDGFFGETPGPMDGHKDLVQWLNQLNMAWTNASKRLSPVLLTELLDWAGPQYTRYLVSIDPFAEAIFPVAWAGDQRSPHWFHMAREYTEKYLHQQQIRNATGRQALMTAELFQPFISTFMQALPYTYRNTRADNGTSVLVTVDTHIGGSWCILKTPDGWIFHPNKASTHAAVLTLSPHTAWQLFSKSMSPAAAIKEVTFSGDHALAKVALKMVSVMA
jgi:uncharacterized protein (TIGR03083 family)